jgi:hypothetical protein
MYLKYHDPIVNKNMLVQVLNMYTRTMVVGFISDCEYQRRNLPKSEEDLNIDAEVIVW